MEVIVLFTSGVIQIFPEKLAAFRSFWGRHGFPFGVERRTDWAFRVGLSSVN